jgi:serine/alanine adding enzyme
MRNTSIIDPAISAEWDKFVENHPFGQIYHLSSWKKILESCFKHIKGYYYIIRDDAGKKIEAGLPFYKVRSWLTGNRLVCAPFATLFDPLVSNSSQLNILSRALIEASHQLHCSYVEIRTHEANRYFENPDYEESRFFKFHYLRLDSSLDALRRNFHRTCVRQRIARAEKSGLQLKIASQESDLLDFYNLLVMTRIRRGLPPQPFSFFRSLWAEFKPLELLTILIAQKDGQPIGALLLLAFKDRVSAEFAASDKVFNCYSPIHYLMWEAIKLAQEKGYKIFDFGRTSPNNSSLMNFKERWGAEKIDLAHFYYPRQVANAKDRKEENWKYSITREIISLQMPPAFKKYIGALCYRHLG